ncbi:unnamed protein product [Rotaria socialis]
MITNKSQQKLQLSSTSRIAFRDALSDLPKSIPPDPNNIKISEKEKNLFKTSLTNWICLNIRSINIIEDEGLKSLIDLSIRIGYMHGPVSVSSLFPCRKTITKEIQKIGMAGRDEMKTVLIKAAKERRLSLSPDLWSDGYKQISYLGCVAQWLDDEWNLCSFDLFCLPYRKPNKSAANLIKVIEDGLELFGLKPFMFDTVWVSDRGSNFKKALAKFTVLHCIAHRLKNVLQHTFYQSQMNKVKQDAVFADYYASSMEDEDDYVSDNDTEDDISFSDDEALIDKRIKNRNNFYATSTRNTLNNTITQLPSDAKRVLVTIIQCKDLVKYIKKVRRISTYLYYYCS